MKSKYLERRRRYHWKIITLLCNRSHQKRLQVSYSRISGALKNPLTQLSCQVVSFASIPYFENTKGTECVPCTKVFQFFRPFPKSKILCTALQRETDALYQRRMPQQNSSVYYAWRNCTTWQPRHAAIYFVGIVSTNGAEIK